MTPSHKKQLAAIARTLKRSKNKIPPALKTRMAEILMRIIERRKEQFGLFIILGWQNRWQKHAVTPDISQDLFAGHNIKRRREAVEPDRYRRLATTTTFDGAILVDKKGNVLHSGVMIEGLWPRAVATKIRPGYFKDLSAQFGFKEKVHTRHLSAITSSYTFPGTTVFTVSEESGSIHIFEDGKILYASPKKK